MKSAMTDERMDDFRERMEFLLKSQESLHANLERLYERSAKTDERIDKLAEQSRVDGEHIRALVRIAEIHERRLSDLEGDKGGGS
jgi:formate dehydrogenase maturation protein FdhE